jgi:uncharacterized membrane protein (UPF0182 family)
LYLRSAGGRIPELKRVIVAYHNQIVMEETLDKALNRLFPSGERIVARAPTDAGATTDGSDAVAPPDDAALARALEHYQRAMKALREGNWALYGEEIRRLGEVLERRNENR